MSKALQDDIARLVASAWEEVDAEVLPMLREDDLTIQRYAAKHGITNAVARRVLEDKVTAGKLVKVRCRRPAGVSGGVVVAFRTTG